MQEFPIHEGRGDTVGTLSLSRRAREFLFPPTLSFPLLDFDVRSTTVIRSQCTLAIDDECLSFVYYCYCYYCAK